MKKILLTLCLLFIPNIAFAQCNGVFGANTACGTVAGGLPGPIPFSAIGGGSPGSPSTSVQYNNSGTFSGITGATSDGTSLFVTTQAPLDQSTKAASTQYVYRATRVKLTAATTYYWRSDGDDTQCTGLTNAAYVS